MKVLNYFKHSYKIWGDYFHVIFWIIIFVLLCIKFYLVTPLNQDLFLSNYKFFTPDSYDWIANGVRFLDSNETSVRQPALSLIIHVLYNLEILYLLPLLNQIVLAIFLFYIFKITFHLLKNKFISYFIVLVLMWNYFIQSFSLLILADLYAMTLITMSFYYLIKNRISLSFLLIGLSWAFQNFSPFLVPAWIMYLFLVDRPRLEKEYIFETFKKLVVNLVIFALPNGIYLVYKWIRYGDPLYTGVIQFQLIDPNLNSMLYYFINSFSVFGLIIFILPFFYIFQKQISIDRKHFLFMMVSIVITLVFWTVLYEWNDRRFLIYLFPFVFPLVALMIKQIVDLQNKINFSHILKLIFVFILFFYPSYFSTSHALFGNLIPLSNSERIILSLDNTSSIGSYPLSVVIDRGNEKFPIFLRNINALYAEVYGLRHANRNTSNGFYNEYKQEILNQKENILNKNKFCNNKNLSVYELNSISLIVINKSIYKVNVITDC